MEITLLQITLISLFYILCETALPFGSMGTWATISRPLVSGLVVGLILGDPVKGTVVGATINIMFLGVISAGGSLPSDSTAAGVLGSAFAIIGGFDVNTAMALSVPLGMFGSILWVLTMTGQCFFVAIYDKMIEKEKYKSLIWLNTWIPYIVKSAIRFTVCFTILLAGSALIEDLANALSGPVLDGLSIMGGMIPAVGIAMMLLSIFKGKAKWFFFLGFLATTFLNLNTIAIALIFAFIAILVVGFDSSDFTPFTEIESTNESAYKLISKKDLVKSWVLWQYFNESCYNYERMQGLGFCCAMNVVLQKIYKDDPETLQQELKTHSMFFNTDHDFGGLILGVCTAMEEQKKLGADIKREDFVAIKSGLMGPCAGIGDTLSQVVLIPILAIIFINLALQGALWAPIAYTVLFLLIFYGVGYWMLFVGYKSGGEAVLKLMESGIFDKVIEVAQIIGCAVSGSMICNFVSMNFTVSIVQNEVEVFNLQTGVLDAILPNMAPLALTLFIFYLCKKGVKTSYITFGLMIAGFVLGILGIIG